MSRSTARLLRSVSLLLPSLPRSLPPHAHKHCSHGLHNERLTSRDKRPPSELPPSPSPFRTLSPIPNATAAPSYPLSPILAGQRGEWASTLLLARESCVPQVLEIINSGKMGFNEAAREYSMDKAGKSGLLGWKRRNELDQDFWQAALEVCMSLRSSCMH